MSTASLHAARFDEVECKDETRTPVGVRFEERSRRRIPHLPSQGRSGNRWRLHGDELLDDLHVRRSGSAKPNVTDDVVSRVEVEQDLFDAGQVHGARSASTKSEDRRMLVPPGERDGMNVARMRRE